MFRIYKINEILYVCVVIGVYICMFYRKNIKMLILSLILLLNISYEPKFIEDTDLLNTKTNYQCIKFLNSYKNNLENENLDKIIGMISNEYGKINHVSAYKYEFKDIRRYIITNRKNIAKLNVNFHIYKIEQISRNNFLIIYLVKVKMFIKMPLKNKWTNRRDINYMIVSIPSNKYSGKDEIKIVQGF